MSVPNQTPYNIYTANGLTTVFAYEFYLISAGDIQVTINGAVVTGGYSVGGVGNVGGGDITFLTPPANGAMVMLERNIPTYRLTDYQDNGDLLADTVNKDFDRLWMAIQRAFIYLGLALTRPLLGGPFNAKGYRIENLGDPVNAGDAVNQRYVIENSRRNMERAVRVPEIYVEPVPTVHGRAGKIFAWNNVGQPIAVHAETDNGTQLEIDLAGADGLKYIGRCPNLSALRGIAPSYNGQVIDVVSAGAQGFGGGRFVHIASMESPTYADDGGTIIAAGNKFWVREELILGHTEIDVLWFGAANDYASDSTPKIQAALDASAFWTQYASSAGRGVFNHRYRVVFPQRWSANQTIVYNPVFTEIDLNNGVGIFLNTGTYGTHPLDANYPVLLYMRCATPVNDLYIPAYGSFNIMSNGTLLFGSLNSRGFPDAPTCYNTLPTTNHVMLAHHGINETLYTALGKISDISIAGAGRAYANGDYAWGTNFFNVKFINNGGVARLMASRDSSEKIDMFGCFAANNGLAIEPAGWNGRVNWIGGSLDYFRTVNPFKWVPNCGMQLNIDDAHIEFNPYQTKCLFDLSNGSPRALLTLSRINMGYAVPSATQGGAPVVDSLIKRNPNAPEQVTLDNIRMYDASASGRFTKNYLVVNDDELPVKMRNMNPIILKDYFVSSSLVNRKTTARWQHYFVNSSAFNVTYSTDSVTITGTAGAIAQDKSVCLFIPAQEIRSDTQFVLGVLKCLSRSVTASFAVYTAYSKSLATGLVTSSDVITTSPIGVEHLVGLQVGVNTNVVSYGTGENQYTLASWSKAIHSVPAEGLMVRLWLFNFVEGSSVTISCNSGLVTL